VSSNFVKIKGIIFVIYIYPFSLFRCIRKRHIDGKAKNQSYPFLVLHCIASYVSFIGIYSVLLVFNIYTCDIHYIIYMFQNARFYICNIHYVIYILFLFKNQNSTNICVNWFFIISNIKRFTHKP
jgi:hypothetical protein